MALGLIRYIQVYKAHLGYVFNKASIKKCHLNVKQKTYQVGGIRKGIGDGKPYYGQGAKTLVETKAGWKICISPMQSNFLQEPKEVDEQTFIDLMVSLGVPIGKVYEFIDYEIDWENF